MGTHLKYAVREWAEAEAAWRWRVVILTAFRPDASADLWSALKAEHDALYEEATELGDALEAVANRLAGRRKFIAQGIADMVFLARDEVSSFPAESFSPLAVTGATPEPPAGGMGKMLGLGAAGIRTWEEVWAFGRRTLQVLMGVGAVVGAGAGTYVIYDNFLRSPASRAQRDAEGIRAWEQQRQADLAACASDADPEACRDRVNKQYDAGVPSKCDILDTPLGSALGGLGGVGLGYAGMRKLVGWS